MKTQAEIDAALARYNSLNARYYKIKSVRDDLQDDSGSIKTFNSSVQTASENLDALLKSSSFSAGTELLESLKEQDQNSDKDIVSAVNHCQSEMQIVASERDSIKLY